MIRVCVALPIETLWAGEENPHLLVLVLVFEGQEHQPKINATLLENAFIIYHAASTADS